MILQIGIEFNENTLKSTEIIEGTCKSAGLNLGSEGIQGGVGRI
jgi:hypothetical protein